MKLRVKRLGHVSLGCVDLEASVAAFQALLGAAVAHEFRDSAGERYGVFLATGGGSFLELFREPSPTGGKGLFRHLCFEVEDIDMMADHVRQLGHVVEVRRGRTDGILQFFVTEPGGTMIEFQQHDDQSTLRSFLV
ncbi:MAG: VOC family protein [Azospirillaceae bacterium]|nr:VOC family protein [Azospirillaceae bacterium]